MEKLNSNYEQAVADGAIDFDRSSPEANGVDPRYEAAVADLSK